MDEKNYQIIRHQILKISKNYLIYIIADSSQLLNTDNNINIIDYYESPDFIVDKLKNGISYLTSSDIISNNKKLSKRELLILQYVAKGKSTKEIAQILNITNQTVSTHRKNISKKLEIKSVSGLTAYAIVNGVIDVND